MDAKEIEKRIAEFTTVRGDAGTDLVAQVEAALYVEEVFGLTLSDEDMCAERLGSQEAILRLVLDRT